MKLKKAHLYGFGKHKERTFHFTDRSRVEGLNEAGKSSLFEGILQILFGFPTRGASNRLEPLDGGRYGGWLQVEFDGVDYKIERVEGKSAGNVSVEREGLYIGDEIFLQQLLKGLTRDQVESVFVFDLFDLQKLHQLSQEDLTELFFASGTTGENPFAALRKSAIKESQALYKPGGRKPVINQQLEKVKNLEKKLQESHKQEQNYNLLKAKQLQLEQESTVLEIQLRQARALLFEAEEQEALQPLFDELENLQRHTATTTLVEEHDQQSERRLVESLQDVSWKLQQLPSIEWDQEKLASVDDRLQQLDEFLDYETRWREQQAKLAELEEQLEMIVREQQPLVATLSISAVDLETKVENYDVSFSKEQQLDELLSSTKKQLNPVTALLTALSIGTIVAGLIVNQIMFYVVAIMLLVITFVLPAKKNQSSTNASEVEEFFKPYGISYPTEYRASDVFQAIRKLQQLQLNYRASEQRLQEVLSQQQAMQRCFPNSWSNGKQLDNAFREARVEQSKLYEVKKELQLLQTESLHQQRQSQELQTKQKFIENELHEIYSRYDIATPEEFQQLVRLTHEEQKRHNRLAELSERLQGRERKELTKSALFVQVEELQQKVEETTKELVTIKQQLELLLSDEQKGILLQKLELERSALHNLVVDFTAWRALENQIEKRYAYYHEEIFPITLKRASTLFAIFSAGAYEALQYQDERFNALSKQGVRFEIKQLSQATKEQAYLALRFALAEELSKKKPFLILMDDPFVHFDANRFKQVVQWLVSNDNHLPFVYFTCHPEWLSSDTSTTRVHLETEGSKS